MSRPLTVTVKGPDSTRALGEFLAIPGIDGHPETMRSAEVVPAIGAIVGIVSGVVSIVAKIIEWREKWKKQNAPQRLDAVIRDARGNELSLDDATPEQITAVLKSLEA